MSSELADVDALWRAREIWLSAAADALAQCERPVGQLVHAPGEQVAWDSCCDGLLYTRISPIELMASAQARPYSHPRRVRATISCGVLRCAAVLDDNGAPPEPDAITTDAAVVQQDMWAVLDALRALSSAARPIEYQVIGWRALGPQGGCVGGEWAVFAVLPTCTTCVAIEL